MAYSSVSICMVASVPRLVRLTTVPVASTFLPLTETLCPSSSKSPDSPLSSTFMRPSVEMTITAPFSR